MKFFLTFSTYVIPDIKDKLVSQTSSDEPGIRLQRRIAEALNPYLSYEVTCRGGGGTRCTKSALRPFRFF